MFYKDRTKPDGIYAQCKDCIKEYQHTPEYRAINAKRRKADKLHPFKAIAQNATNRAIRKGVLIRPNECSECLDICKAQAHHDNYNKPLEVRWLCRMCHNAWHKVNKPIEHKERKEIR